MSIKKDLQKIYNSISEEFSSSRAFPWEELKVFIPYLKDGDKILDLGCGNGRLLKLLGSTGKRYHYLGLDFSEQLINEARKKFPQEEFRVQDITTVDLPASSFDAIIMIAVFHHLPTKEERLELLKKINRWLKPGGYLFMTNWNLWQKKYFKYFFKNFWQKRSPKDFFIPWKGYTPGKGVLWRYYHSFSVKELEKLLSQANFSLEPRGVYQTKWNINFLVKRN